MAETTQGKRKSTLIYWVGTIISTVATVAMLMFADSWFWVGLPFLFTFLALATRAI